MQTSVTSTESPSAEHRRSSKKPAERGGTNGGVVALRGEANQGEPSWSREVLRFRAFLGLLIQLEVVTAEMVIATVVLVVVDSGWAFGVVALVTASAYAIWTLTRPRGYILVLRPFGNRATQALLHCLALRALSSLAPVVALQDRLLRRDQFWGLSALAVILSGVFMLASAPVVLELYQRALRGGGFSSALSAISPAVLASFAVWWALYRKRTSSRSVERSTAWLRQVLKHRWLGLFQRHIQVLPVGNDVWTEAVERCLELSHLVVFVVDAYDDLRDGLRWEIEAVLRRPGSRILVLVGDKTGHDVEFIDRELDPLLQLDSCRVVSIPISQWGLRLGICGAFDLRWRRMTREVVHHIVDAPYSVPFLRTPQ